MRKTSKTSGRCEKVAGVVPVIGCEFCTVCASFEAFCVIAIYPDHLGALLPSQKVPRLLFSRVMK
jgi:hypothetical protein